MKAIFIALLIVCATGAMGQGYAVLSSQPQAFEFPDHPEHAGRKPMAKDQNLRGDESPYTYAQGEIPLREVARASTEIPLGDVARRLKTEHASAKKAAVLWEN
jgi:hypothetical protein